MKHVTLINLTDHEVKVEDLVKVEIIDNLVSYKAVNENIKHVQTRNGVTTLRMGSQIELNDTRIVLYYNKTGIFYHFDLDNR
jgi:hypothetical protein